MGVVAGIACAARAARRSSTGVSCMGFAMRAADASTTRCASGESDMCSRFVDVSYGLGRFRSLWRRFGSENSRRHLCEVIGVSHRVLGIENDVNGTEDRSRFGGADAAAHDATGQVERPTVDDLGDEHVGRELDLVVLNT